MTDTTKGRTTVNIKQHKHSDYRGQIPQNRTTMNIKEHKHSDYKGRGDMKTINIEDNSVV